MMIQYGKLITSFLTISSGVYFIFKGINQSKYQINIIIIVNIPERSILSKFYTEILVLSVDSGLQYFETTVGRTQ